jgi:type II secretory pathway pseudopilin PulG
MIGRKKNLKGAFTLVEMLVYLAIFFTVTTAATYLLITVGNTIDRYRVQTLIYRSGSDVMEHIVAELRQANQFNTVDSVTNTATSGVLALLNNSTSTIFTKNDGELLLSINGTNYGNMVGESVFVDGFTVYRYSTAAGTMVRVKLALTANVGSSSKSTTFYTGAVIRGDL